MHHLDDGLPDVYYAMLWNLRIAASTVSRASHSAHPAHKQHTLRNTSHFLSCKSRMTPFNGWLECMHAIHLDSESFIEMVKVSSSLVTECSIEV